MTAENLLTPKASTIVFILSDGWCQSDLGCQSGYRMGEIVDPIQVDMDRGAHFTWRYPWTRKDCESILLLLLWQFLYLGSAHRVVNLHFLHSCASSIFAPFSFKSFLITSLHLKFYLSIFRCPPTSIFHVLITTLIVLLLIWCHN